MPHGGGGITRTGGIAGKREASFGTLRRTLWECTRMDNERRPKRPPKLIAKFFELFTPRGFRMVLAIVTHLDFTTVLQFCIKAQRCIRLAVLSNAREAFDVRRHAGDVLGVILAYFAYWAIMTPIWLGSILVVA